MKKTVKELFGKLPNGCEVFAYTLVNDSGMSVKILNYGGIINQINVPDKKGVCTDVIGGYDNICSYLEAAGYQGAVIGRFGNRIGKGKFALDGAEYTLACNNGENHLHGGVSGFDKKIWQVTVSEGKGEVSLQLDYISKDGEEGYPGTLNVRVIYSLTEDNALSISYFAKTDKKTVLNLTNHAYFNLSGYGMGNIRGHILTLDASSYLPTDAELIPTGEFAPVDGTPFDFRNGKEIGRDIDADFTCLKLACGYDHCMNFTSGAADYPVYRGKLFDPASGRIMELYTDMPCVQLYTGNFLGDADYPLKNNLPQKKQGLLCLETQKMPDSPNKENFTDCTLAPGDEYRTTTVYKFSAI